MSDDSVSPPPGERLRNLLQEAFDARRGLPDEACDEAGALSEEELRVWSRLAETVQRLPGHPSRSPSAGFTDRVMAAWKAEQAAGGFDDDETAYAVASATDGDGAADAAPQGFAWRTYGPWIAAAASALLVIGAGLAARQMGFGAGGHAPAIASAVPTAAATDGKPGPKVKTPAPTEALVVAPQRTPAAGVPAAAPENEKLSDLVGQLGRKSWSLAEATGSEMQDVALLWKQPGAASADPEKTPAGGLLGPWTADSKRVEDRVFQAVETLWNGLPPL